MDFVGLLAVALFLSQDTKAETLEVLIRAAKQAVEDRARVITAQASSG